MSKRMRILLGGTLLTLISACFAIYVYSVFLPKNGSSDGYGASWDGTGDPKITYVNESGPATGLVQLGDDMIAINGVKIRDNPSILLDNEMPPGTRFTLTLRRAGELRDVSIVTVPYTDRPQFDSMYYISLLFLLTGWVVFLLRPDDNQAWLLAVMLATLTGLQGDNPSNLPLWLTLISGAGSVAGLLFCPVFVHFFLIFPDRSPLLRRWPGLETWLYLPFLLIIFPAFGPSRFSKEILVWMLTLPWLRILSLAALVLVIAYMVAGLAVLVINYRAASPIARRRLRVVMSGSAAGFFNLLILILGGPTGLHERFAGLWWWFEKAVYVTFPLVPLSFVYAIVRHKVIPVSLIIRRGVRYLLVSRGSVIVEAAVVILAITVMLTYIFSRFNPPGIVIGTVSAGVAIVAWKLETRLHEKYLAPIIDRKFFRESYNSHQIIADLTDSLRSTTNLPQLYEQVATKIQTALKTENVTVLLRDDASGDYFSTYSCEFSVTEGKAIACHRSYEFQRSEQPFQLHQKSLVIAQLRESRQPLEVDSIDDPDLREMKSALLLPLLTKQEMPGIISIGSRLGDLPFSGEDKALLMSVAGPTTFAIENSRLVERMIEEARRREEVEAENEQRARELEEARQLQLSMLPKTVPQLPHLEIAAYMKTATEVGGDYYDFHLSDNGDLTIVVGDATGHGLKAGTVVTATKSLFNHLAETPDVTEFFYHSSRALKRMNLRSLFMAMTVARIKGHVLTLSSAGMPPTLIYRAESGEIEQVPLTGIPLGSLLDYRYRQQQIQLNAGDVVVLMSDGLPERFNEHDEMLDYERTKKLLADVAEHSSQEIIQHLIRAGDEWANGRPQDDDVTFVVLKVK